MTRKTLARSFILVVLVVFLAGQGLLWLWFLNGQKKEQAGLLADKVKTASALLGSFSVPAILSYDYTTLDQYIEALSGDGDLLAVKISDRDGNPLRQKAFRAEGEKPGSGSLFFLPDANVYRKPIESAGEKIGEIEIRYSGHRANRSIRKLVTVSPIGQAVVFLLIMLAIYYFFQRRVGRPIDVLNRKLESITEGDLTTEIEHGDGDEIDSVASGLSFLKESLVRTITRLNAMSQNVGMAIRQLDTTFGNVSGGMKRQSLSIDEITAGLKKAAESQNRIGAGTDELSDFSAENVTSLLQVKATADEIAASTGRLFQAVEDSHSALAQLSQSAKAIAESTQDGLSSVEETAASVEEMNASVKEIERSARESTALAERVKQVAAEEGVLVVADAIDGMEKIAGKVQSSVEMVSKLGARSKDIEKMLSVIKDVTEQTNLLSLNAAILAAQAGEYGKGFSVVADEIRALSERTASSTRDIAAIVKTIQSEMAEVVSSIGEAMRFVEKGREDIYRAGASTGQIVEAAQSSAHMTLAIQRASEEQVRGLAQISLAVEHIRQIMHRMAGSTEEQVKGTSYMLEKMGEVREIAESTRKGTIEQAAGTKHITDNLELANERINDIREFVHEQEKLGAGAIGSAEKIRAIGVATSRDVEDLSLSLGTLQAEIDALTKEMERFRIDGKVHPV
jgi:methyl-accepting chemotaxis protein